VKKSLKAEFSAERLDYLDYVRVHRYWNRAKTSALGPYVMDGFGLSANTGIFRFKEECKIVEQYLGLVNSSKSVLDLGSGVGFWTEYFAKRFSKVISLEASDSLYNQLHERARPYTNVETIHCNVMSYTPDQKFGLIFLGGLAMYLNEPELNKLLHYMVSWLEPDGIIIFRESTVRYTPVTLKDDYQVVYRTVAKYKDIFNSCHLKVVGEELNTAYIGAQMPCEIIKKWKAVMPKRLHFLSVMGPLIYWIFRLGHPWSAKHIPVLLEKKGIEFPKLSNHFFILRPQRQK